MKLNFVCAALLATAISSSSSAQVSIYIGSAPPPIRYEERGAMPGPGYTWIEGYWAPNGHRYSWVQGRWERPPYEGAYWSHPHYDHYREGWQLHEGHWDHEDHENGHGQNHGHEQDHHGDEHHGENHDH
jgi:hypothetical protein